MFARILGILPNFKDSGPGALSSAGGLPIKRGKKRHVHSNIFSAVFRDSLAGASRFVHEVLPLVQLTRIFGVWYLQSAFKPPNKWVFSDFSINFADSFAELLFRSRGDFTGPDLLCRQNYRFAAGEILQRSPSKSFLLRDKLLGAPQGYAQPARLTTGPPLMRYELVKRTSGT